MDDNCAKSGISRRNARMSSSCCCFSFLRFSSSCMVFSQISVPFARRDSSFAIRCSMAFILSREPSSSAFFFSASRFSKAGFIASISPSSRSISAVSIFTFSKSSRISASRRSFFFSIVRSDSSRCLKPITPCS